jgi:hypothetical protein
MVLAGERGWSSGMSLGRLTLNRALRETALGCILRFEWRATGMEECWEGGRERERESENHKSLTIKFYQANCLHVYKNNKYGNFCNTNFLINFLVGTSPYQINGISDVSNLYRNINFRSCHRLWKWKLPDLWCIAFNLYMYMYKLCKVTS